MANKGKVWLVGAGTGDIGLLTRKAMDCIKQAEVIVYDALLSLELLALLPTDAELIDAGKRASNHTIPQEEMNQLLLDKALEGKRVVRLKGGDPFVFGRGGEELELLVRHQIPFEVVPGITSSIAVAAYNGIPVTHRDYTSSFHVITGHQKKNGKDIDYASLVKLDATLIFLMGVSALETICNRLIKAGMNPDTPAAILEKGTTCRQRRVVATVSTLKKEADAAGITSPAVIVVGKVCVLEQDFAWFEKLPLFGKQILVTRPKASASKVAKRLRQLGAQVIELPMIETVGVTALTDVKKRAEYTEAFSSAVDEMLHTPEKVCVAFTSPRGVEHFFEQLKEMHMDMRTLFAKKELSFAVLGSGTAKALEQYNVFADYMPRTYSVGALGRLLAKELKDTSVYMFRAQNGSKEIDEILEQAQLPYRDIVTYFTKNPKTSPVTDKIAQAFACGEIDEVMFTSASTVEGFVKNFPELDYSTVHAVCIGEQTANAAGSYGIQCRIAKEATIEAMVAVLQD